MEMLKDREGLPAGSSLQPEDAERSELPDRMVSADGLPTPLAEETVVCHEMEQRLQEQASQLKEMRAALRVLMQSREEERMVLEKSVIENIDKLIEPFLSRLEKTRLNEQQRSLVEIIRANLTELTSPFAVKCSSRLDLLSPAEVQIANLIKLGKRTKEIAQILRLSPGTISIHRKNIRKKLELTNRKVNLQTSLSRE